jgi:hypothetical protein
MEQFKVTVQDEYGDSWTLWYDTQAEVDARVNEYPQYDYTIEDMGKVTLGMLLSVDAGETFEVSWLSNDLSPMQIQANLSLNENYLVGLAYSGKSHNEIREEAFKEKLNKQYDYQRMLMSTKD